MNEQNVIKSAQNGDREALRLLFEENRQKIFSLAYQYVKNAEDAEDILTTENASFRLRRPRQYLL